MGVGPRVEVGGRRVGQGDEGEPREGPGLVGVVGPGGGRGMPDSRLGTIGSATPARLPRTLSYEGDSPRAAPFPRSLTIQFAPLDPPHAPRPNEPNGCLGKEARGDDG